MELAKAIFFVMVSWIFDFLSLKMDVITEISRKNTAVRWLVYICLGLAVVFFSQKGVGTEFIYFQF